MMDSPVLEIPDSKPIRFSDLAHMLASSMWPDKGKDDLRMDYGAARLNLESELKKAAEDGSLPVRNASTLSRETFIGGAALGRCVVLFHDLAVYFAKRGGYELRPAPYGQGPEFWTIEGAAAAIADQEMWHIGAREALQARMVDAAAKGALVVRDPQTDLPYAPTTIREYYDLVTPADVNSWLSISGVGYRWAAQDQKNPSGAGKPALKAVPRALAHEQNILRVLRELSFDPKRLPKAPSGRASQAKQAAKRALPKMSNGVFDAAWQRLRKAGELLDA